MGSLSYLYFEESEEKKIGASSAKKGIANIKLYFADVQYLLHWSSR